MGRDSKCVIQDIFTFDCGNYPSVELMHIADTHIGDKNMDIEAIYDVRKWVLEKKGRRFITIGGDILNAALKNSISDVYDEMYTVDQAIDRFCEIFEPISKYIICVTDGNHDRRITKAIGLDPVKIICARLNVRYYAGEAFFRIDVGHDKKGSKDKRRPIRYYVYMNHGYGGGRMVGSTINTAAKAREVVVADLYLSSHTHKPSITPYAIYEFGKIDTAHGSKQGINKREQYVVISKGFLKRGGYAIEKVYAPLSDHSAVITLNGREKEMSATI